MKTNSKTSINFFFSLHNFMDRRFLLPIDFSNLCVHFFPFHKQRNCNFSLKACPSQLPFGISKLQHHYSGALGPLLRKIMVIEHKHYDIKTLGSVTNSATNWQRSGVCLTKGWFAYQVEKRGPTWDFIRLLRMACSIKLMNSFWQFQFNILILKLTLDNWNPGEWNRG